jgi:DnaK suppressor protein
MRPWIRCRTRSAPSWRKWKAASWRIEIALERIREGHYGICEGCGCTIPIARLNALPYATLCIKCQRESEREGAGGRADVDWSRLLDSGSADADVSINDIELDVS